MASGNRCNCSSIQRPHLDYECALKASDPKLYPDGWNSLEGAKFYPAKTAENSSPEKQANIGSAAEPIYITVDELAVLKNLLFLQDVPGRKEETIFGVPYVIIQPWQKLILERRAAPAFSQFVNSLPRVEDFGFQGTVGPFIPIIDEQEKHLAAIEHCRVPPAGWYCTRKALHAGPCAAIPIPAAPVSEHSGIGVLEDPNFYSTDDGRIEIPNWALYVALACGAALFFIFGATWGGVHLAPYVKH